MAFQGGSLRAQDAFEWRGRMGQGQTLEVQGIVGSIRTVLASGDQVEVVALKRGEREDFPQVAVEMAEAGDRIVICAVYGSWNHGQDRCHPDHRGGSDREDRRHRNVDMDVSVDYEVRLPAGVEFDGTLVSGDIRAESLRSDVHANTVDGDITVSTSGRAWVNTVAGNLDIEMGDYGQGDLEFHTVSGDIILWLPADLGADVSFSSLSGDLDSELELAIQSRRDRWVGSRIRGTLGGGGREISLQTISGDVEIRRSRR
jgi:hypothetical protein